MPYGQNKMCALPRQALQVSCHDIFMTYSIHNTTKVHTLHTPTTKPFYTGSMLEPMETTYFEEGELVLGLAIATPESCATPLKAVSTQNHDMWEKAIPSNILKENFNNNNIVYWN